MSIAMWYCFSGQWVFWPTEVFTATHTPGDTANHGHFSPYLICMCILAKQNTLANQNLRAYNTQIMPNCWRASSLVCWPKTIGVLAYFMHLCQVSTLSRDLKHGTDYQDGTHRKKCKFISCVWDSIVSVVILT